MNEELKRLHGAAIEAELHGFTYFAAAIRHEIEKWRMREAYLSP